MKSLVGISVVFMLILVLAPITLHAENDPLVRILETPSVPYFSLQEAYDNATDGNTIQCRTLMISEAVNFDRDISVSVSGGYNNNFSAKTGDKSVLVGYMQVTQGTVSIGDFSISSRDESTGYDDIGSNVSTDMALGTVKITMPIDENGNGGTIKSIVMFHESGSGSMILGVYSNAGGVPSELLSVTQTTTISSVSGWQTIDLITPLHVDGNDTVWVAWLFTDNPGIHYTSGPAGSGYSCAETWSSLGGFIPSTFPAGIQNSHIYSIYVNYVKNDRPQITQITPVDRYTAEGAETIVFGVTAEDFYNDYLEYQFIFDENVVQSWTTNHEYSMPTQVGDFGEHGFVVEVRDNIGAITDSAERHIFIFRKPVSMDQ